MTNRASLVTVALLTSLFAGCSKSSPPSEQERRQIEDARRRTEDQRRHIEDERRRVEDASRRVEDQRRQAVDESNRLAHPSAPATPEPSKP